MAKIKRSLAIVIGINEYSHIRKLKNAVSDAQELGLVLEEKYGYKVLPLLDEEASKEKLDELLANLESEEKTIQFDNENIQVYESDRLLFYFAGHGFAEEAQESEEGKPAGYFMPQNAEGDNRNTWLSMEKVYQAFTNLNCHHLLMILDCCFAGRISWVVKGRNAAHPRKLYKQSYDRFIQYSTQQIITSASHDEEAQDSFRFGKRGEKNGHSPFAYFLLKVLEANSNGGDDKFIEAIIDDKVITAHELFTYLQNELGKVAEGQTPALVHTRKKEHGQYVFLKGEYIFPLPSFNPQELIPLKLDKDTNPYKGLASFETNDSQLFYGRKRLIEEPKEGLISMVKNHELTVVLGLSGSGKSSLVKAGLIPALKPEEWYVLNPMRPGESPLTALARSILPIINVDLLKQLIQVKFLDNILNSKTKQEQESRFNDEEKFNNFVNNLVKAWEDAIPATKLLLVFKYFEQLKKLCSDSEKQQLNDLKEDISKTRDSLNGLLNPLKFLENIVEKVNNEEFRKLRFNNLPIKFLIFLPIDCLADILFLRESLNDLVKAWKGTSQEAKPFLVLDYFEQLKKLCSDSEKQQLNDLKENISKTRDSLNGLLNQLKFLEDIVKKFNNLMKAWEGAIPEAKLLLVLDYFELLKKLCSNSEKQHLLSKLKDNIEKSLNPLIKKLQPDSQYLTKIIEEWSQKNQNIKLLLVIDQAEELITLCRDEPKRERFLQLLAGALRAKELSKKLHILLTLRFEFEPQIRDLNKDKYEEADWQKAWQELWQNGRFLVTPMDREELQQVIEEPAAQRALFFESPKLVNDLIDEVVQMPGALPLLSFTLSELYLEYLKAEENGDRNDRTITEADYQEIGGVTRSLTETADKTYRELVEKEKVDSSTIRDIMLRMVASSGGELARRRVPTSELVYPEPKNEQAKKVIKHFITARLLVKEVIKLEDKNQEYVEPVHDALITGWKKIKDWLEEKQEIAEQLSGWNPIKKLLTTSKAPLFLASKENNSERDIKEAEKQLKVNLPLQRDVTTAAFKWEDNEKEAKYLWNASPYLDVLKLVLKSEQNNNWLNQIETEFVKCSVEQKRKNTYIRWGIAIAVILALSGLTILSRYNANIADRRRINADVRAFSLSSKNLLDSNQQLEATIDAIKAGRLLEDNEKVRIEPETQMQAITALQRVVYINRLPNQIELPNFREINRLEKHNSEVRAVSFSNDGAMIATASGDNTIIIWQTDGTLKKTLTGHTDIVRSISFSPDNRTLVSASNDLTLVLWNLDDGTVLRSFKGHTGTIPTVTFSPNGQLIASASADGTIKIWNPEAGLIKTIEKAHPDPVKDGPYVQSVQFSPDGQLLASAGYDGLVKLWTTDGKLIDSFDHGYIVWDISFSPDGQTLASAGQNGKIKLWSRDGTLLRTLKGHLSAVRRVDFSSDGETLASAGQDNTVKIWSKDGTLQFKSLKGHSGWVWDVAFSPVNSELQILASASEDGTVKLWRQEETTLRRLNVGFIPNFIRFSPDGTTIATGNWEGILLWNVENNQVRYLETRSTDNVSFSLDGQILAIAGRHEIKLWNLATNKSKTLEGHKENVSSVLFNPYEKLLASGSWDKTVKLWNFDNLDGHINKFCENKDYVSSLSFSPDGKLLAFGSWDGTVKLWPWNLECQAIETVITHGNRVQDVSFSPDGNMIASASSDNTIKLLTLGETDPRTLRGHNAWVLSLSFHPNGKILATGSSDQTVKLWGIDSGSEIETLKSHTPVEGALGMWPKVSFNPDGKILASTSPGDKTIVLWNFDLKDLLAQACGVAGDYLQTNPNVSEDDRKLCH